MQFFKDINIDFLGARKIALIISGVLILAGLLSLIIKGGPEYNIDFTGGRFIELQFSQATDISLVRTILSDMGLGDSEVQGVEGKNILNIRTNPLTDEGIEIDIVEHIRTEFKETAPENSITILRNENVGPKIGKELKGKALWAVLLAVIAILIYVSIRFQFRFGVAAIIALIHDVVITLGLFSIFGKEMSLPVVAAFLTIVGYSINDTIVISDRIRENLKLLFKEPFANLVNISLNQTFSRTIVTSLVVLLVVGSLLIFGGKVIHDFSLALFIGIIVGTYSSIYVVSPIVVAWEKKYPKRFQH